MKALNIFFFLILSDVDLFARPHFNEDHASHPTAIDKRALDPTATSQLDCSASHNLENVQVCGRKSVTHVSAERKCTLRAFYYLQWGFLNLVNVDAQIVLMIKIAFTKTSDLNEFVLEVVGEKFSNNTVHFVIYCTLEGKTMWSISAGKSRHQLRKHGFSFKLYVRYFLRHVSLRTFIEL